MTFEYQIGHLFRDVHHGHVSSLDFSDKTADAQFLITVSEDGIMAIYDCLRPALVRTWTLADPAHVVQFSHSSSYVLYASNKTGTLAYMSLVENAVVRKFSSSEEQITKSLSVNPANDTFLTATDSNVFLWDLKAPSPIGKVGSTMNGGQSRLNNPMVAFDPLGQVFTIASDDRYIRLYDSRNHQQGPFASFDVVDSYRPDVVTWSTIAFSPDGAELLVTSKNSNLAYLIDSFEGTVLTILQNEALGCATYMADNSAIMAGCTDGSIAVWERIDTKFPNASTKCIEEAHMRSVSAIACNKKFNVLATACTTIALWISNNK